jgi:hypothetical protein
MHSSTYFKLYTILETLNEWQNMVVKHEHEVTEKRKNKFRYVYHRGERGKRIT